MKLGYFVNHFPYLANKTHAPREDYYCGGAEYAAFSLADAMEKRGHTVYVFTTSQDGRSSVEEHGALKVFRYPRTWKMGTSTVALRSYWRPLDQRVELAHTHFDMAPHPLAGYIFSRVKRVPLVLTYHGDWVEDFGGLGRRVGVKFLNRHVVGRMLDRAEVIISPSRHFIEESLYLSDLEDKIRIVPNGVNVQEFSVPFSKEECKKRLGLPADRRIILFVGALAPSKDPGTLIEAFKVVHDRMKETLLVVLGDGMLRSRMEEHADALGVGRDVFFCGYVQDKRVKSLYYASSDIFCLPSITECLPLVILEAMAAGLPVVASRVGGIPDLIESGKNGILVPPSEPSSLVESLLYLLENEEVRSRFGAENRRRVLPYSWESVAERTESVYAEVLA
ncbi:MAG TPA: glycosyltransferase family 4 protein [Methanomicrobiales archaeon]|nr:glycosyltransferase family 4 protein [Methanomicrobiales archaeon]